MGSCSIPDIFPLNHLKEWADNNEYVNRCCQLHDINHGEQYKLDNFDAWSTEILSGHIDLGLCVAQAEGSSWFIGSIFFIGVLLISWYHVRRSKIKYKKL